MKEDHRHPPSGCSISCVWPASGWGDRQTPKAKAFSFFLSVRASGTRKAGDEGSEQRLLLKSCAGSCYCRASQLGLSSVCPVQELGPAGPSYHACRCPSATWTKGHFCQTSSFGARSSSGPIAGSGCPQLIWPAESGTCQRGRLGSADHVVGTQCPKGWRTVEGTVGEGQRTRAGIPSPTLS